MMKRIHHLAWLLFALIAPALAQHAMPRNQLAASAAVDTNDTLWVVSAKEGRLWLQHTSGSMAELSTPQAVTQTAAKITAQGENRPKIAITPNGVMLITWTIAASRPYAGHVMFTRSTDGGRSFEPPRRINDDARDISHRFDNLILDGRGRAHIVWIDRRDVEDAKTRGEQASGAALYTVSSMDEGATWSPNQRLADAACECCRIALALDPQGQAHALWRHIFPGSIRDHATLAIGSSAPPTRASFSNWQINACPHHGPALAIDAQGTRHLIWFAGKETAGIYYSRLDANGLPQGQATLLTERGAHPAIHVDGSTVAIAWLRFDGAAHRLELTRSTDGGNTWHAPILLATTQGAADYPQWLMRQGRPQVLWRTADQGFQLISIPKP